MEQQKVMEDSFLKTHRDFINNLTSSLDLLKKDMSEANEMQHICTDEWCRATKKC